MQQKGRGIQIGKKCGGQGTSYQRKEWDEGLDERDGCLFVDKNWKKKNFSCFFSFFLILLLFFSFQIVFLHFLGHFFF
ncbi:hypothetical protein RFI_03034 [Reticulomyxa filosa]|uniref:Transmembrane protein n=1 Tax=Reticulomyxa filosa TaxID=46433 RepID=X6P7L7_RETFI|nr:hypothetical protein RFI_03034 [Reticulomyxa filosa]|eukprot:ETO34059.1 hypothetical protein RFI_03034 [Reticulomyxa filosa]